jgi:hypothetical protein
MDLPAKRRAERVRQVLASRGLSLYRVSQQSAEIFGRSSPYYVPHNLYYDIDEPSLIPTFQQMLALSHITGYQLRDWFAVFGFDLDLIPRLRLLARRKRTTLLDTTVYDLHAWIPWFVSRERAISPPPIAPLGQILRSAPPMRATDVLALGNRKFLYGKVGEEDIYALPHLAPGSIVRVDPRRSEELAAELRQRSEKQLFFVEHDFGCTCSQLVLLAKDRILLHSPELPCAQLELKLGRDARILGRIDAEIRRVAGHAQASEKARLTILPKPRSLGSPNLKANLQDILRSSRLRAGLSFREASSMSRWIANLLADESYFAATSTLSDYETLSTPPRHIQKAITLCVLYSIDFLEFLATSGLPLDRAGRDWMPDELVSRQMPDRQSPTRSPAAGTTSPDYSGFLDSLVQRWGEIPLFLRRSLDELTSLTNLSLSDAFWVGGDNAPIHPWLVDASLVAINRRIKRPAPARASFDQPLYLILKRDGTYLCGCCALHQGELIVPSYPGVPLGARHFRNRIDAEVIGQVTTILRRLA